MVEPTGSVTVVTGGGGGIGRALAVESRRREGGTVLVVDREGEAADETARLIGPSAVASTLDVADADAVAMFVGAVERDHGAIDTWFSNAGVNVGDGLGEADAWQVSLDVNLLAHVGAARAVLPGMERRGKGRFVMTASAAGLLSDLRSAAYSASKHALVGLAEWLAIGVADGVAIHCVCPEAVRTGMTRASSAQAGKDLDFLEPEAVATAVFDAMARDEFLIATHPRTLEFAGRRCVDRARWLGGMRKARVAAFGSAGLFPPTPGDDRGDLG